MDLFSLAILAALVLAPLALLVVAFVILLRTPEQQITFEKKWVWALIIIFVNALGSIIFFVCGRQTIASPRVAHPAQNG